MICLYWNIRNFYSYFVVYTVLFKLFVYYLVYFNKFATDAEFLFYESISQKWTLTLTKRITILLTKVFPSSNMIDGGKCT